MDLRIAGRRALVTGASAGIGRATALALLREGVEVVAIARGADALEALRAEVDADRSVSATIEIRTADVSDPASSQRLVDDLSSIGGIDILVNNVGGASPRHPLRLTEADWHELLQRNLLSAVRLCTALVPRMAERGWGRVVHVGSVAGREPGPELAAYGAAKAALIAYSKSLSNAVGKQGVRSNVVLPGLTDTLQVQEQLSAMTARNGGDEAAARERMLSARPAAIGRMCTPDEVADAITFLCSERSSAITGACLAVDGGTILGA